MATVCCSTAASPLGCWHLQLFLLKYIFICSVCLVYILILCALGQFQHVVCVDWCLYVVFVVTIYIICSEYLVSSSRYRLWRWSTEWPPSWPVAVWMFGCVAVWLCSCVAVWPNSQATQLLISPVCWCTSSKSPVTAQYVAAHPMCAVCAVCTIRL